MMLVGVWRVEQAIVETTCMQWWPRLAHAATKLVCLSTCLHAVMCVQ